MSKLTAKSSVKFITPNDMRMEFGFVKGESLVAIIDYLIPFAIMGDDKEEVKKKLLESLA